MALAGCDRGVPVATEPRTPGAGEVGLTDSPFTGGSVTSPTGEKPQSSLWFNDGTWWGVMFDDESGEYYIHRYEWDAHAWSRTSTTVDERNAANADVLWDGRKLYVLTAGPNPESEYHSARLQRFSYDASTDAYLVDTDFPTTVTPGGAPSMVLAKDTTGQLWITYVQKGNVYVNHSVRDDADWARPFVLPVPGSTVTPHDVSAVVSFGSEIGVMWSNQAEEATYFATHKDGDAADAWRRSTALAGPNSSDDHINLKAARDGRVFAAVKTSYDEAEDSGPSTPLNLLLVRERDGSWSREVFGTKGDQHTKPIVLLDEEHADVYVIATTPCCNGGSIVYKRTSMNDVSFAEGRGTPLIESRTSTHVNNATSTKQTLNRDTGLLVEASDETSGYYLNGFLVLGDEREGAGL